METQTSRTLLSEIEHDQSAGRLRQAYLVVGSIDNNILEVTQLLEIAEGDQFELEDGSIASMRRFVRQAGLTPTAGPFRLGLITDMTQLSTEAEQSFLKTLEEPAPRTIFLLGTSRLSQLPTTLSRVKVVRQRGLIESTEEVAALFNRLRTESLSSAFQLADELAERSDCLDVLAQMMAAARQLPSQTEQETLLNPLLKTWQVCATTNASRKLQLAQLVLELQSDRGTA